MKSALKLAMTLCIGVSVAACSQQGDVQNVPQNESGSLATIPTNPDTRIIISLSAEQRLHVLDEMNQFLLTTQEIVEGLSLDDPELVQSAVADSLGHGRGQGLMKGALPPEFRQMGSAMKEELGKIDTLSKEGADNAQILDQLSTTLNYCQSCHVSYQIRLTETP